jgi:hypothetical protein
VDRLSFAEAFAVHIFDRRLPVLEQAQVAAHVTAGTPAVRAPERGVALLIDDRLWPIGPLHALERNDSLIKDITTAQWDAYERGGHLLPPPR